MAVHLLGGGFVVQRPHGRALGERVTEADLPLDRRLQRLDELVVNGLVYEEPLAGGAALPGAEKRGGQARLGGSFDVCVVQDDHRAVSAQFEERRLACRSCRDVQAGRHRADEADGMRTGITGDLVAYDRTGTEHHREHAGGQLRVDDAFGQLHGADGCRRRRGPDDGVSGRERGCDHLGGHRVRPVPRSDDTDDAARYAVREDAFRRIDRRRHRSGQPSGVGRGHAPVDDELLDLAVRLGVERLALVESESAGEVVPALLDEIRDAVHGRGTLEC